MKLYGGLASPYVARVVLFARLKGLALVPQMPAGGLKSADYLAKNPMGKMPALEVDGTVIPESEVICEYLEDVYPDSGGLLGTPLERTRARLSPGRRGWHREVPGGTRSRTQQEAGLAGLGALRRLAGAGGPGHAVLDGHRHVDAVPVRSLSAADHRGHGRQLPHRDR